MAFKYHIIKLIYIKRINTFNPFFSYYKIGDIMSLFYNWKFYIVFYLIVSVIFNIYYKKSIEHMDNSGAMTIVIQMLASVFTLFLIPFYEIKISTNLTTYIFLFIAIIFYTLNDRLGTLVRNKLSASIYSIMKQLSIVFMLVFGIVISKERITFYNLIGSILIILANILILYKHDKLKINKYIICGVIANISLAIAMIIDVSYSNEFNLAIYVLLTTFFPSILIFVIEKIKIKSLIIEYKNSNKASLYLTSISWIIMMISKISAYRYGKVILVAPLSSLSVILISFFEYFVLRDKNNIKRKIICSLIIILGIILIKYF